MLRTFARAFLVAAAVMPLAACSKSVGTPATSPGLEPVIVDPAIKEKRTKESVYQMFLLAGSKAVAAGELDSGIDLLNRALTEKPDGAEAHVHLARAYIAKRDDATAGKELDEAVRINAQLVDAYAERAAFYERLGKLDDAVTDYRKVIALDTDRKATALAYWLRGGIRDKQGDRSEFRFFREQAMKLDPDFQKQVTGADLLIANKSEVIVTLRIDQLVKPDGTVRTFPPDVRFKVRGDTSVYATYRNELLMARSVRATIINQGGTREVSASYKSGTMSLELVISEVDVPK
jgi:tetratricopeptide (TPR) repeat protein